MEKYYKRLKKILSNLDKQKETIYNQVILLVKVFIFLDVKNDKLS